MNQSEATTLKDRIPKIFFSAVVFWLPLIAFFRIADEIREQEGVRADSIFLEWLHHFATPSLNRLFIDITDSGNASTVIVITLLIGAYLLTKKQWRKAAFFLGSVGGAALADAILKEIFHRARPSLWSPIITETDYSFPSGHAVISMALALSIIHLLWHTQWRWIAVVMGSLYVIAVGLSRLYLGVHFPTDIIAGWCVSAAWIAVIVRITRKRAAHEV